VKLRIVDSLAGIDPVMWDALACDTPFLRHAFLHALHESACASPATGWTPSFLTLWDGDRLAAAMPRYFKTHSWGEFVFDWSWADAYRRLGREYYPKLVAGVPFTPVTGTRLLAVSAEARAALIEAALGLARESGVSSLHILFPTADEASELAGHGLMLRRGMQLHWRNPGYAGFDDYLADLRQDKRKKVRQERRRVREAGIRFEHLSGSEITAEHWRHFVRCYERTHLQFDSPIALNLDFFERLGAGMGDNVLLIVAFREAEPIASAWFMRGSDTLYGRSWGTLEYHPGLHFETCYYQAIDYCIGHGLARLEGGAQGEHKLARGFLPETTWSAHWFADDRFASAVADFLRRESTLMTGYVDELNERAPFKPGVTSG